MTAPSDQPSVLRPEQLDLLRRAGRQQSFRRGATIFAEGDRSEFAVVIDQGKVKVTSEAETGYTSVLALRGVDELIGEFGCIDGAPRSGSAIALTQVTATLIPSSRFRKLLEREADILFALLVITIARVRESDRRRLEFGAYSPSPRTVRVLIDLAERHGMPLEGSDRSIILETYQYVLAGAAGVSRETVVRTLHLLAEQGLISTAKGRIVIHDLDVLRNIPPHGQM